MTLTTKLVTLTANRGVTHISPHTEQVRFATSVAGGRRGEGGGRCERVCHIDCKQQGLRLVTFDCKHRADLPQSLQTERARITTVTA